jgi:regulator of cell morphogenesis and NO signaling
MNIDTTKTVREMALSNPGATRVFETLGIDYCCGGNKPFELACREADVQVEQVLASLKSAAASSERRKEAGSGQARAEDWRKAPLADLITYIKDAHHKYVKEETNRLGPLFEKVYSAHGSRHPELLELRGEFQALAQELFMHMMKEELVLFPYIERMEEAVIANEPVLPPPFGTVNNPVIAMVHEHDSAGNSLRRMHELSDGYRPPQAACTSFKTLYSALAEFESDLHQHIHLENNILFPRAIEMERRS